MTALSKLTDEDGIDGPFNREMDRIMREDKRKRARKPKVSPFERCRRKLDAALTELRESMRKIDQTSPLVDPYGAGNHWYGWTTVYGDGETKHTEFFAPGPALALIHAEWAARLFDAIRECCR